MKAHRSLGTLE